MAATLAKSPPIVLPYDVATSRDVPTSRDAPASRDVPTSRDVRLTRAGWFDGSAPTRDERTARYELRHVSDEALHVGVKSLAGRYNGLTAELLAHLAEVDARGIYRERACSSLYTYCVYELRFSEDEAQRRSRAARAARAFPVVFEMLAEGAIHLTGVLLLAPYLTAENHAELLARARFRTKREIEHMVAEVAPRPDVPARIEPLGPRAAFGRNTWQAYTASLRGPVRPLVPGVRAGEAPQDVRGAWCDVAADRAVTDAHAPEPMDEDAHDGSAPARVDTRGGSAPARAGNQRSCGASEPLGALRYRVEFTVSERYVELLEEARNLLQHQVPDRDVARVHELAMAAFVEQLRKRRLAASERPRRAAESDGSAPARVARRADRYVPAAIRREVWRRDGGCCTFEDASGRRCRERAGLEIHHEHAFALGGATTLENLRLMCRSHNALLAERGFGRAHVERRKSER
jgi:hypothetical protein